MIPGQVNDSDALGYLVSQLAHIEARIWERKYTAIMYPELVPVSFEASEWAESIEVHFTDGFTEGKFVNAGSDDIPFARINTGRDSVPVNYGGIGFEYSLDELRKATALRRPLNTMSADKARRGYEEHAQRIAFFGDAARGTSGLLNHTAVPTAAAASTIAAALLTGTPGDSVAAIFNELINSVIDTTNGIEIPNRVLAPISILNILASTRLGTVNDTTILEYVRTKNAYSAMSNGQPLDIRGIPQLTNSMVAYSTNEDVMVYHIPMPLRFIAPQPRNLMIRVPGEYKLAGLEMRYPLGVAYRTGI